jgi:hypothetical protein
MSLHDLNAVGRNRRAAGMRPARALLMVFGLYAATVGEPSAFAQAPYENEPINYSHGPVNDPVARLARQVENGDVTLNYDSTFGYLPSLLERLGVPIASQALVFSKTSLQIQRISPSAPRAVYFNDDVYVGFVRGGHVLEISAADEKQGAVFYTLPQEYSPRPQLARETDKCLSCHSTNRTRDVPGHLMRSVAVDANGFPVAKWGSFNTTQNSPLGERWGGWYVTGSHGGRTHMGNSVVTAADPRAPIHNAGDMGDTIDTSSYLAPTSDVVSLMVLAHQAHMHNLITRAGYEARMAAAYDQSVQLGGEAGRETETSRRRLDRAADELVRYMLFLDEAEIENPIIGSSPFAADFPKNGPQDRRGRSLRDLDLNRRLLKYPCSYLIYGRAFEGLPETIKSRVYRKLWEILTAQNRDIDYAMTARDRQNVLEILCDTKHDLPSYWKIDPIAVAQ